MAYKELERRVDGVMMPSNDDEPIYVVEFQGFRDHSIYARWLSGIALTMERHPNRTVNGVCIFLSKKIDPKTEPWYSLAKTGNEGFKVLYLVEEIKNLMAQMPDHPAYAAFSPLLIEDAEELKAKASGFYEQLNTASNLEDQQKSDLIKVLHSWVGERFKNMSSEEVWEMLEELTPFEETRMYQELVERELKGRQEGRVECREEGREELLDYQLNEGIINLDQYKSLKQKGLKPLNGSK